MNDLVELIRMISSDAESRLYVLYALLMGAVIGVLVVLVRMRAVRHHLEQAIERRVFPAFRFAMAILCGFGCVAALIADASEPWGLGILAVMSFLCAAYFGRQVIRP